MFLRCRLRLILFGSALYFFANIQRVAIPGAIFDRLVGERETYYTHTLEGDDDMPAHAKSTLTGVELTIPVTRGRLNLGTWQGIYLCEFRNRAPGRRIVATIIA